MHRKEAPISFDRKKNEIMESEIPGRAVPFLIVFFEYLLMGRQNDIVSKSGVLMKGQSEKNTMEMKQKYELLVQEGCIKGQMKIRN